MLARVFFSREEYGCAGAGGIATYVRDITGLQTARRRTYHVTAKKSSGQSRVERRGRVVVVRLSPKDFVVGDTIWKKLRNRVQRLVFFYSYRISCLLILFRIARKHKVSFIEVPEFGAEAFFIAFSRFRGRLITRIHGPSFLNRQNAKFVVKPFNMFMYVHELIVIRRSRIVSSPSSFISDWIQRHTFSKRSFLLIENKLDLQQLAPFGPATFDRRGDVVYFGTISTEKNAKQLFRIARELDQRGLRVDLIGRVSSRCHGALNQLTKNHPHVSYVGELSRSDLLSRLPYYQTAIFPATNEPFGLVVLEALASGLQVVANASGAFVELSEKLGFHLVNFDDISKTVDCIHNSLSEDRVCPLAMQNFDYGMRSAMSASRKV